MAPTSRRSKRTARTVDSDHETVTSHASQSKRTRVTGQATLSFAPPLPIPVPVQQLTPPSTSSGDTEPSTSSAKEYYIDASKRIKWNVDYSKISNGEYRLRYRSKKTMANNKISWIFAHGSLLMEWSLKRRVKMVLIEAVSGSVSTVMT